MKNLKKLLLVFFLLIVSFSYSQVKMHLGDGHQITTDFLIEVEKGRVDGHSIINKFGRNGAVTTDLSHISIGADYRTPINAQTIEVYSTNANDNSSGIGAQKVEIQGLGPNWQIQIDTVIMNGVTPVQLSKQFTRIYRARVLESGSYVTVNVPSHLGQIYAETVGTSDVWFIIDTIQEATTGFGIGQTQIGTYSVEKGVTAYLLSKTFSSEATKETSIYFFKRENIDDVIAPYTGIMRLFEQNDGIQGPMSINGNAIINVIKGPAEVGFFAKTNVGTASVSVEFQLLLIKDNI